MLNKYYLETVRIFHKVFFNYGLITLTCGPQMTDL